MSSLEASFTDVIPLRDDIRRVFAVTDDIA